MTIEFTFWEFLGIAAGGGFAYGFFSALGYDLGSWIRRRKSNQ